MNNNHNNNNSNDDQSIITTTSHNSSSVNSSTVSSPTPSSPLSSSQSSLLSFVDMMNDDKEDDVDVDGWKVSDTLGALSDHYNNNSDSDELQPIDPLMICQFLNEEFDDQIIV